MYKKIFSVFELHINPNKKIYLSPINYYKASIVITEQDTQHVFNLFKSPETNGLYPT